MKVTLGVCVFYRGKEYRNDFELPSIDLEEYKKTKNIVMEHIEFPDKNWAHIWSWYTAETELETKHFELK